jgi:putative ABC transport system permease protein
MTDLLPDVRYALRRLGEHRAWSAVIVLTLALGIGANAALFSVIEAVLLRALPLPDADRLVGTSLPLSVPDFFDWQQSIPAFERLAVYNTTGLNLSGRGEPKRVRAALVSADFFPMVRVQALRGRLFLPAEYRPGGGDPVAVGEDFWRRGLGGDASLIGRALVLNGRPYTVVGILPAGLRFPERIDLWVPHQLAPAGGDRGANFLTVVARLRPGAAVQQAQMQINLLTDRLQRQYPQVNQGRKVEAIPLAELAVRRVRPMLLVLLVAVALVLLLACANVANLQLASGAERQHELAVRTALGARRLQLVRQMLTESLLLSLLGAASGLLLAWLGTRWLTSLLPPGSLPRWEQVGIDGRVLAFTFAVGLLSSLLFGLGPALQASEVDVHGTLRRGSAGAGGDAAGRRLRHSLVVAEIALALLLLVGGGLAIDAFRRLQAVDPGFDPAHAMVLQLDLPAAAPPVAPRRLATLAEMMRRIEELPGVQGASVVVGLPLSGKAINGGLFIAGRPDPPPGKQPLAEFRFVSPGYWRAMRIPLLSGRDFTLRDAATAPLVAIVNRTLARHFWPTGDAVGQTIGIEGQGSERVWMQIIGVAGDVRHYGLGRGPVDEVYMPLAQQSGDLVATLLPLFSFSVVVRSGGAAALTTPIVHAIHDVDPGQPISEISSLQRLVAGSLAQPRFAALLLALFAGLALALAAAGTYSVMAYTVARRTHEIGLRMALGAGRGNVLGLVLTQVARLTLVGLLIGLLAALAASRLMAGALLAIRGGDPIVLSAVVLLLALSALTAALFPALRASRVDPMIALREARRGSRRAAG